MACRACTRIGYPAVLPRRAPATITLAIASSILFACLAPTLGGQSLALPARQADAPSGSEVIALIGNLSREQREARLFAEIAGGNVPSWLRTLVPVTFTPELDGRSVTVTFHVTPDYLAVGSDDDWFLTPLTPGIAQRLADLTATSLPTPAMVDAIWRHAAVRLGPDSIAPSAAMVTVPVFAEHNRLVRARRDADPTPLGALVAGHKKDVVLTARLDTLPQRVAIYGWHRPDGTPIQPLYTGHGADYADYSHGIRLVDRRIVIDGDSHDLLAVLRDATRSALFSRDGTMQRARYPTLRSGVEPP